MAYALLEPGTKDHFYVSRQNEVTLGVIHTAEITPSFQGNLGATGSLVRYGQTTSRSVSWHDTAGHDAHVPMLPFSHTAWHVRGYNSRSVGIEIATRASLWAAAPDEWTNAALFELCKSTERWVKEFDLPIRRITKRQADAGVKGLIAHGDLDPGRRSDPGITFPWGRYLDGLSELLDTPKADRSTEDVYSPHIQVPGTLRFGDRGPEVRSWQVSLLNFNNRILPQFGADGDFGGETRSGTREFQKFARIGVDGIVGGQTREAMAKWNAGKLHPTIGASLGMPIWSKSWPLLRDPSRGARAKLWQQAINAWRPGTLAVDSTYGPVTARATVSFQRDQRLGVDGIVGAKSWNRMRSLLR